MAKDYKRQIATAKRMIKKYGTVVDYQRLREGVIDETKPWIDSGNLIETHKVDAVFITGGSSLSETFAAFMAGTTIPEGKLTIYIPDIGFQPSPKDTIIKDGIEYRFSGVGILKPADQIIMSAIGVKG